MQVAAALILCVITIFIKHLASLEASSSLPLSVDIDNNESVEIVTFVCGSHYLTQIGPFIASILTNNNRSLDRVHLSVYGDSGAIQYLSRCHLPLREKGLRLDVIDINDAYKLPSRLEVLTVANPRWKCGLNKLVLAEMLPKTRRVLFLDVDTVVQEDLSELWAAFVVNPGKLYYGTWALQHTERSWHPNGINTGVMLVDLDLLRTRNITVDTYLDALGSLPAPLGDQTVLNHWLSSHPTELGVLPCKWNKRRENQCAELLDPSLRHCSGIAHGPNNAFRKMWDIPYEYGAKFNSICKF